MLSALIPAASCNIPRLQQLITSGVQPTTTLAKTDHLAYTRNDALVSV